MNIRDIIINKIRESAEFRLILLDKLIKIKYDKFNFEQEPLYFATQIIIFNKVAWRSFFETVVEPNKIPYSWPNEYGSITIKIKDYLEIYTDEELILCMLEVI